ncbi:FeoA domain-containing protein, partial [Acinetobacter baumannii]
MRLSELSRRATAVVDHVEDRESADPISQRLRELGFVAGDVVRV